MINPPFPGIDRTNPPPLGGGGGGGGGRESGSGCLLNISTVAVVLLGTMFVIMARGGWWGFVAFIVLASIFGWLNKYRIASGFVLAAAIGGTILFWPSDIKGEGPSSHLLFAGIVAAVYIFWGFRAHYLED